LINHKIFPFTLYKNRSAPERPNGICFEIIPAYNKQLKQTYMKHKLIIIATALVLVSASCLFFTQNNTYEAPVSKDINVEVYKTASYVSPAYANTFATLQVTVIKVNGNKKDTAFQHTFQPKELKDYPASDKPLIQKITIPNVKDSKEKLEIYYKLTYDTKGSVLKFLNITTIGKGQQTGKLHIEI